MKLIENVSKNNELELLKFQSVRLIGSYVRVWTNKSSEIDKEEFKSCKNDDIKKKLQK